MSDLLNSASLVMIPSGYKEDVVYSQIPTDGSGDLSFTRASNGTRVNSAGLVEVVAWNLLEQSNTFSTSPWANTNVTLTSGQTDPNGGTTAFRAQFSGVSYLLQNLTALNGTNSIYAKAYGSTAKIRLCDPNGSFSTQYNLTTEWQRITTSGNALAGISIDSYIDGGWTSQDIVIAFAQVNIGSTAKPYFPTTDRLNVPRLTYQNGGGGCPSLLLEKQSTNLFTYSEQMDNADWFKQNLTITANQAISPDGTQNADLLDDGTASSTQHWIYQGPTFSNSTAYTISFYAKYVSRKYMTVNIYNGSTSQYVDYDIQNGTILGSTGDVTASITSVGNGWYRIVYTRTMAASGSPNFRIGLADDTGSETYTGSNKQVYMWGAQLEASSYPTSYIPTTSSSATRVADGPLNLSTTQTLTNFTLFWDGLIFENGNNMFFGSGNSAWYVDIDGSTGRVVLDLASGRIYNAFGSFTSNQRFKLAIKRSAGVVDAFVNGTKLTPNTQVTDTTSLTLSSITWGFSSTYYPKMKVNEICAFQSALSDSDCQALTTL